MANNNLTEDVPELIPHNKNKPRPLYVQTQKV